MQGVLPSFYLFNNGFNDEEALRYAISESLDEEISPPLFRQNIPASNDKNIQTDPVSEKICQVLDMVKNFKSKISELINLDISSNSQNISHSKNEENLSDSQKIRRQQDIEFQEALELAKKEEEMKELRKKEEEEEANEQRNYPEMIKQKFIEIGNEPNDGILLAVSIPNKPKITRHFAPESFGSDVYIWVAANEFMISSGLHLGKFNLVFAGKTLDDKKSLIEQDISSKTLFSVVDLQ